MLHRTWCKNSASGGINSFRGRRRPRSSGPEVVDRDLQTGEQLRPEGAAGAVGADQLIPLLAEAVGFERPGARIDDPVVGNARGGVTLHLDAAVASLGAA